MKKRLSKFASILLCVVFIVSSPLYVSADTADKPYDFWLSSNIESTKGYYKDNSSSVYVNPTMSPVEGVMFGGFRYTSRGTWANETIGAWAYIAAGTKRRLRTNIYENAGYNRVLCRLSGRLRSGVSFENKYASGWWSPDTAGSYPAAN